MITKKEKEREKQKEYRKKWYQKFAALRDEREAYLRGLTPEEVWKIIGYKPGKKKK